MRAINIDWDIEYGKDKEPETLPNEIEIPKGMEDEKEIFDYITNVTGVCHFGFELIKECAEE